MLIYSFIKNSSFKNIKFKEYRFVVIAIQNGYFEYFN